MTASSAYSQGAPTLLKAIGIQGRVIGALMMRELHTRYGRDNIGYMWMIGEPMMLATVIGLLHGATGHTAFGSDIKPLPFAVLGYTVFILFRGIVSRSEGALEGNTPLLYHRMVTVADITLARTLLEFAGVFGTFVVLMTLIVCIGYADPPARPLLVFAAWMLMLWYALGHALVITALSYDNRTIGRLVHPYTYFMTGLSSAFFQISWIPHPYREWLQWIPITSIFELARYGQFRSADLKYFHGGYLISSCAFLTWVGLVLLRRLRSRIHLS